MNYFISMVRKEDGFDWCIMESTDYDYISRVFEDMVKPPEYNIELRATEEDIDTYLSYEVLRYDRS